MQNIAQILRNHAHRIPEAVALRTDVRDISYSELDGTVRLTTTRLREINITDGKRVGLCLKNDVDTIVLIFALAHIGAPVVVMGAYSRPREKIDVAQDFDLSFMISDGPQVDSLPCVQLTLDQQWRESIDHCIADEIEPVDCDHDFIVNTSSGTTGRPKGIVLSHAQYCRRWQRTRSAIGWSGGESHLSLGLLAFTGARNACLFHLLSGNRVILRPHWFSLSELIHWVHDDMATSVLVAPILAGRLLSETSPEHIGLLSGLKYLWFTGGTITGSNKATVCLRLCANLYDEYGASGFGTISCLTPQHPPDKYDSVGPPVAGVSVEIVDDKFRLLPAGEIGRIRCQTDNMPLGFENDDNEKPYEYFRDGWFYTGDLGLLDKAGFLYIRGRTTDLIICGDVNVYPEEVEAVLKQHPAVREAAVVGKPDGDLDEQVLAFVSLRAPCDQPTLIKHCRARLSAYKVPDAVYFLDELPLTTSGKLKRKTLVESL